MLRNLIVAILAVFSLTFSVHVVQAGDIAITTTALSAASLSKTMRATEGNINLSMSATLACIPLSLNEARNEIYYSRPEEDPFVSPVSQAYYQYRTDKFPLEYLIISNSNQASQRYAYRMSNWQATEHVVPEARNYTQVTATPRSASRDGNLFFTIDANLHMVTNNPLTGNSYGYNEGWGPLEFPYQNGSNYEQIRNKVNSGKFLFNDATEDSRLGTVLETAGIAGWKDEKLNLIVTSGKNAATSHYVASGESAYAKAP